MEELYDLTTIRIDGDINILGGNIESKTLLWGNDIWIRNGNISLTGNEASISGRSITIEGGNISTSCGGLTSRQNDISISGGIISLRSSYNNSDAACMYSFGAVSISGGQLDLEAVCTDTSGRNGAYAIMAATGINISENDVYFVLPSNGTVIGINNGQYHFSVADSNGDVASRVIIHPKTGGNVIPTRPGAPVTPENTKIQLPPCDHNYEWRVITEATATADGVEGYICTKCGDVKERRGLAALEVFEAETAGKILNAPANGTINIECMPWNSFGHTVKDAMTKRPDVTIKASFLSKGHTGIPLKVTIPAGRVDLFDSNGYLGLCRAGTELGYDN